MIQQFVRLFVKLAFRYGNKTAATKKVRKIVSGNVGEKKRPGRPSTFREKYKTLTIEQKEQFQDHLLKKIRNKEIYGSLTYARKYLTKIIERAESIANKLNKGQKLNKTDWRYVKDFSEWFGDIAEDLQKLKRQQKPSKSRKVRHNKLYVKGKDFKSTWVLSWRWNATKDQWKPGGVGDLEVQMKAPKYPTYVFPGFPFEEKVMLSLVKNNLGTFWWRRWLWRYSTRKGSRAPIQFIRQVRRKDSLIYKKASNIKRAKYFTQTYGKKGRK